MEGNHLWNLLRKFKSNFHLTAEQIELFHQQDYLNPFTAFQPEEMTKYREIICNQILESPSPYSPHRTHRRHLDSRTIWNLCSAKQIVDKLESLYGSDLVI